MMNVMVIIYLFYKVILAIAGGVVILILCPFKVFDVVLLVMILIGLTLDVGLTIGMCQRIRKLDRGGELSEYRNN